MTKQQSIIASANSCHDWSSATYGESVHRILSQSPFEWDAWGTTEPYTRRFGSRSASSFVRTWCECFASAFASLSVLASSDRIRLHVVSNHGPKPHPGYFALSCPPAKWKRAAEAIEATAMALFHTLRCYHGRVCAAAEYHAQHYAEEYRPTTRTTRVVMLGIQQTNALSGVYWGNLFGPPVVDWVGADKIRSCPCERHTEWKEGFHLLTAYSDILDHASQTAVAAKDRIRSHLGPERFFDRRVPDRQTLAPPIDLAELCQPSPEEGREQLRRLQRLARETGCELEQTEKELRLRVCRKRKGK